MCIETNLSFSAKSELDTLRRCDSKGWDGDDRRLIGDYFKDGTVLLLIAQVIWKRKGRVLLSFCL